MKKRLPLLIAGFGLAAALPLAHAEQGQQKKFRVLSAANEPDTKFEKRVVGHHAEQVAEKKKVAFLGVETSTVAPELSAQLTLPPDSGLVVRHIVPDSPAASTLQQHDILLKLDDQLLIDPRQFAVLVRNHKTGDEVTVTYVRGGKEATAKVALSEHEVPKVAFFGGAGEGGRDMRYLVRGDGAPMPGEELNRTLALLDRAHDGPMTAPHRMTIARPGFRMSTVNPRNSNMVFSDDQGSLELTIKEGQKTLVAKNAKGDQVYSGPIDTPEQRKALPEEVRARLDKIEGMQDFTFRAEIDPDADVLKPAPRGIALPLPPEDDPSAPREPAVL